MSYFFGHRFFSYTVLFFAFATSAGAQNLLDIRVIDERLSLIENQILNMQGQKSSTTIQTPTVPEETLSGLTVLPTDIASRLQVRILQIESLVEKLTGQMEETRFEVLQIRGQLTQVSNDVAYRLAVLEQLAGVSAAVAASPLFKEESLHMQTPGETPGTAFSSSRNEPLRVNSSEAFVAENIAGRVPPDLELPMSSPVQPQPQIGVPAIPPSGIQLISPGEAQSAPMDAGPINQGNTFGVIRTDSSGNVLPPAPSVNSLGEQPTVQETVSQLPPRVEAAPAAGAVTESPIGMSVNLSTVPLELPDGTPNEQYDFAFDLLRRADYARAESALRMFLEANPDDALSGNAQYWLGETFYVRGDFEQAAVEFLTGYQNYENTPKAPDNLLKLGLSMAKLEQIDGACSALTRLATNYPEANDTIRRRAQTERARLNCS